MTINFDSYLRELRKTPLDEQTEHTSRSALEDLLNQFAAAAETPGITVQHEPKREAEGAPDFKMKRQGMILGYVEVKEIGANLDKVLKSNQIKRYRTLSDNIILTDYLQFVWIGPGGDARTGVRGRATLVYASDLEGRPLRVAPERAEATAKLLASFFSEAPLGISRAQQLALALAARSQLLRDFLTRELTRQAAEHREGRLFALYDVFRQQVFRDLSVRDFADAFAQMLAYGLFLARLNAGAVESVTLENVRSHIPGSFGLIRELVRFLEEMNEREYLEARWVVDEVLSIVNGLNLAAIHEDLSFRQRKAISRKVRAGNEEEHRLFERDPFIYFYEDYLKAYDPAMRKGRGVYYTPPPIVNFIVRAVDDALKDQFGIGDGLADHRRVTVLDFACGTGTFLLEVFQRIFDTIDGSESGRADPMVREHILENLYGFEYLIAPYTIAHLKLSQYLKDQSHPLQRDERLKVYLTNTLEPISPQPNLLLPAITAETEAAQAVKDRPILVIIGNPPYAGHSKNKGAAITAAIAAYRQGFPELSKPAQGKWLQDDYVKFIRFAQMKMENIDEGIVGVITNHSWLDNPTFKGMRKSLLGTFNHILVLDLHGSRKKRERAPDGGEDQNVFDIEQGVAISLFVKQRDVDPGVWHADLWGRRLDKYQRLAVAKTTAIDWTRLKPSDPDWLFKPQDADAAMAYRRLWAVQDIFAPVGDPAPGIVTTHDQFAISFSPEEARMKVLQLLATENEAEARRGVKLCTQDQWSYERAKAELPNVDLERATVPVLYQPFDVRWTIWDRNVAVHRRERVSRHMLSDNIALNVIRKMDIAGPWSHVLVSERPISHHAVSSKEVNFSFPLWLNGSAVDERASAGQRTENLSAELRSFLDGRYDHHYTPEEIFGYSYAVLHAPAYRARYAEFLRTDFPRIPFPEHARAFERVSQLGWGLVQAHLLRQLPRRGLAAYHGRGDHVVEVVRYAAADQVITINTTQSFRPVPQAVWDFHIGGYQVLDKYLKSRRGRVLSLDEITHVGAVADSLAFTIDQMSAIDEACRAAFPDWG